MKKLSLALLLPLFIASFLTSCSTNQVIHFVTFDSKGGSHIATLRVNNNETIQEPENPVFSEHHFEGWYITDPSPSPVEHNRFDFSSKITSDITLYASWTKIGAIYHEFSFAGNNCTILNDPVYHELNIEEGSTRKYAILPSDGFVVPKDVTFVRGASCASYSNGILTITSMSEDVQIEATAEPLEVEFNINFAGEKCKGKVNGVITDFSSSFQYQWSSSEKGDLVIDLEPNAGYTLPKSVEILFDNVPAKSGEYRYNNNQITIIKKANALIKVKATSPSTVHKLTLNALDGYFEGGRRSLVFEAYENEKILPYIRLIDLPISDDEKNVFTYYAYSDGSSVQYNDVITDDVTLEAHYAMHEGFPIDNLDDISWENIKKVAVTGDPSKWFKIGATKKIQLKHQKENIFQTARIIAFHQDYINSSKKEEAELGITFEFANVISDADGSCLTCRWASGTHQSYDISAVRSNLFLEDKANWYTKDDQSSSCTDTVLAMLPRDLTIAITPAYKSILLQDGKEECVTDSLFLPAELEVGYSKDDQEKNVPIYEYYKDCTGQTASKRIKKDAKGSSITKCSWLRTRSWWEDWNGNFSCYTNDTGKIDFINEYQWNNHLYCVAPAFCI